ncbi:MAG: efflux RND transporter periplasmic adaptor subunit [Alphaproteobacteria bacterium]|nr:efflux RND transporter periplasmic adaptor subunit [Alphaproteobacteria bacterium]
MLWINKLYDSFQSLWKEFQQQYQKEPLDLLHRSLIVLLLFSATLYGCNNKGPEKIITKEIPVKVASITRQNVENTLNILGTVRPFEMVAIKSRIDSQIMHVGFQNGENVQVGDTLFVLDDRVLKAQLRQLTADLGRYKAELDRATRQLQRDKKLSTSGYSSQATFDASKSTYETALANIDSTEAQIENIKTQLDFTVIKAPISGRVGTINVTLGNTVKANDTLPLVIINHMSPIGVKAPVPQRYYQAIRAAMKKGDVPAIAKDSSGKIIEKGKVLYKENMIDEETRTLSVQATFENKNDQLWPGMFVEIVLILGVENQVLTVPIVSVRSGQKTPYIFVVRDGMAVMKPVTVIQNHYDLAVVEGDIKEGDLVVTDGFLSLKDNLPVKIHQ